MLDTIYSGPLNCGMFQMKAANLQNNTYPPAFPLKHMTKDAKFIVDTAFELGAPVPVAQTLLHLYSTGVAQGWGDEDISAIAKVLEHLNPKMTSGEGGRPSLPLHPPLPCRPLPWRGRRNPARGLSEPAAPQFFSHYSL